MAALLAGHLLNRNRKARKIEREFCPNIRRALFKKDKRTRQAKTQLCFKIEQAPLNTKNSERRRQTGRDSRLFETQFLMRDLRELNSQPSCKAWLNTIASPPRIILTVANATPLQ